MLIISEAFYGLMKLNDGSVNRHNCVFYASNNQPGITVWVALCSMGVIGPYFFEGNVKGDNYLEMLTTYLVPQLQQWGNCLIVLNTFVYLFNCIKYIGFLKCNLTFGTSCIFSLD